MLTVFRSSYSILAFLLVADSLALVAIELILVVSDKD